MSHINNPLESSDNFNCRLKQCYSYERMMLWVNLLRGKFPPLMSSDSVCARVSMCLCVSWTTTIIKLITANIIKTTLLVLQVSEIMISGYDL